MERHEITRQRRRVRIGDVVEIQTAKGLAYAQYTHDVPRYGALIRVLPGFHERRPSSFAALVEQREQFVVFFPLGAAVWRRIFVIAANEPVPEAAQHFPLFRCAGAINRNGKVLNWWLWDGNREWRVDSLTLEQRRHPEAEIWNDTLLIKRIEEGYTPEKDFAK